MRTGSFKQRHRLPLFFVPLYHGLPEQTEVDKENNFSLLIK
ncbi:hypothetical protein GCWU000321_01259 [Dialister invisus DSM 15470]|uniref:Uncharacterized protein n=1 Tax=Dialister invisus DSM 15470 TaxID=592028 RepID=C9LNY5_9FIRM|nr:hypothetical protein GCWU000321_01259 [Dialister invisus DSM 15470]